MSRLLLMLWLHYAHAFWRPLLVKQTEIAVQDLKHKAQPPGDTFLGECYRRKGQVMVLEDSCYWCTCSNTNEAVCRAKPNCDALLYSTEALLLPQALTKVTRSKRFSENKFAFPGTMNLRRGSSAPKAKCTMSSTPYSIGCPPNDWCEGCTICQCRKSGYWDCNILSFCPNSDKQKQKQKKKTVKNLVQNNVTQSVTIPKYERITSTRKPLNQNPKHRFTVKTNKASKVPEIKSNLDYKEYKYKLKKNHMIMKKQIYQKKLFRNAAKEIAVRKYANHTDKIGYVDGVMINQIKINTGKNSKTDTKVHKNCGNSSKTSEITYKVNKRGILNVATKTFMNVSNTVVNEIELNMIKREIAKAFKNIGNAAEAGRFNNTRMKREIFNKNEKMVKPASGHSFSMIHNNFHNKHTRKTKSTNSTLDDKKIHSPRKSNHSRVSHRNVTHFRAKPKIKNATLEKYNTSESCEPVVSSYSIGCPADDWCTTGCTICDCMENRKWNCYILSFCPDGKGHHFMIKQKTVHKEKPNVKKKYSHKIVTDPVILTNLLHITGKKTVPTSPLVPSKANESCINDTFILESEEDASETPKVKTKKLYKLLTSNKSLTDIPLINNKIDSFNRTHHHLLTMPVLDKLHLKTDVNTKNTKSFVLNSNVGKPTGTENYRKTNVPRSDTSNNNEIRDPTKGNGKHKKIRLDKLAHPKVTYMKQKSKKDFMLQKIRMKPKSNSNNPKNKSAKVANNKTLTRVKRDLSEDKSSSLRDPVRTENVNRIIHIECVACHKNKIVEKDIELIKRHIFNSSFETKKNITNDLQKNSTAKMENNNVKNNKHIQLLFKTMKKAYGYKKREDSKKNIDSLKKVLCAQNRKATQKSGDKTRLKALRFLRQILRQMFYGHIKNITDVFILESMCDEYGPCLAEQKLNETLKSKVKNLFDETTAILRTIFSIKKHLQLIENKHNTCNKSFNCDVQIMTYIFNATCSPGDTKIKPSVHVESIKEETRKFIGFVDNFTHLFSSILGMISRNKSADLMIARINNETTDSLLKKLKKVIQKHDLNENKFIKAVLESLPSVMDKISSKDSKDTRLKYNKTIEQEFADTIKKIKKVRDLIRVLEKNKETKRPKRHISDTDGLEFVLSTMEYWLKRKDALMSEPEQDGIDLLIEVIKNGPDVIEIQKSSHKSANIVNVTRTPPPRYKMTTTAKTRMTKINALALQYEDQRFYPHFQQNQDDKELTEKEITEKEITEKEITEKEVTEKELTTTTEIVITKETKKNVLLDHLYHRIHAAKKNRIPFSTSETRRKITPQPLHHKYQRLTTPRLHIRTKTTSTRPPSTASEEVYEPVVPEVFPDEPYLGKVFIQNSHGQDRWSDSFIDRNDLLKYPSFDDDGKEAGAVTLPPQVQESPLIAETQRSTSKTESTTLKGEYSSQGDTETEPGIRLFQPLDEAEPTQEERNGPNLDWVDARFTVTTKRTTTKRRHSGRAKTTTMSSTTTSTQATEKLTEAAVRKNLDIMEKKHKNFLSSLDYEDNKSSDDSASKETHDREGEGMEDFIKTSY